MPTRDWNKFKRCAARSDLPGYERDYHDPLHDFRPARPTQKQRRQANHTRARQCLIIGPAFKARTTWLCHQGTWRCTAAPKEHSFFIGKSPAEMKAILANHGWSVQWL